MALGKPGYVNAMGDVGELSSRRSRPLPGLLRILPVTALVLHSAVLSAANKTPAPAEPEATSSVEVPTPQQTEVPYPATGKGRHTVIVELVLTKEGGVASASIVEGAEPFASAALSAATDWRFTPARKAGKLVSARIRYAIEFVPPNTGAARASGLPVGSSAPVESSASQSTVQDETSLAEIPEILLLDAFTPKPARSLSRAEIRQLPGAFGDPFRAIEALPGVVPIISGLPYFFVRGAPTGNTGYFFDGIRIPTLFHFALGPAVLHPALVDSVNLHAGAYSAKYGGFAGGIVTSELTPPRGQQHGEANIRLLDSGALLEVPFAKGRGNATLAGRYSYTGGIISLVAPDVSLSYWDYQARVSYSLDLNDRIEVFSFGSRDAFRQDGKPYPSYENDDGEIEWAESEDEIFEMGFHRVALRWDHMLEGGMLRQSIVLGNDRTSTDDDFEMGSTLVAVSSDADLTLSPGKRVRSGLRLRYERFRQYYENLSERVNEDLDMAAQANLDESQLATQDMLNQARQELSANEPDFDFSDRHEVALSGYTELAWDITPKLRLTPGLRADLYFSGRYMALGIDPRLELRYLLGENITLIHALGITHQTPSFLVPIPGVKPSLKGGLQKAIQSSAGLESQLPWHLKGSATLFQNAFFNLTDLIGGGEGTLGTDYRAFGHAYGLELMLHRDLSRRLGGLASYTLSRSTRSHGRYSGLASFDRTHVLNLLLGYYLGANWRFGNRLVVYTGIPTKSNLESSDTSIGYFDEGGNYIEQVLVRPPDRTPIFYRLDWRLERRWSWGNEHFVSFVMEVLNTTLNQEALSYDCNEKRCTPAGQGPIALPSLGVEGAF